METDGMETLMENKIWWNRKQQALKELVSSNNIDIIHLATDESYISPLINFFKKRGSRF